MSGSSASDLATLMAKFKLVCLNDVEDIDDFWQIALSGSGSGRDIGNIWSRNGQRALSSHMYNVQFKHRTHYMMEYEIYLHALSFQSRKVVPVCDVKEDTVFISSGTVCASQL